MYMLKKHTTKDSREVVAYFPGLGGASTVAKQLRFLNLLNKLSRKKRYVLFDPKWESLESKVDKEGRFHTFMREQAPNKAIGVSAGATVGVLAMEEYDLERALLICGKTRGSEKIGLPYQKRAPAFVHFVQQSERAIVSLSEAQKNRTTCFVPIFDGIIETVDMVVPGSRVKRLPTLFHTPSIIYSLIRHVPRI